MARPVKNFCDYFSHDRDMRNHRKIKAIRTKFGITGYAVWCMLLEYLTGSDGNELENSDVEFELIAGDFGVSVTEIRDTVNYCIRLELLFEKDGFIHSESLNERLKPVYLKRGVAKAKSRKQSRSNGKFAPKNTDSDGVSVTEMPQSKVKYIKVKKDSNDSKTLTPKENTAAATCENSKSKFDTKKDLQDAAAKAMFFCDENLDQKFVEKESKKLATKMFTKQPIKNLNAFVSEWLERVGEPPEQKTPEQIPPPIIVDGKTHLPKMNGNGYVYPTIRGKVFNDDFTEVVLQDDTYQRLSERDSRWAATGAVTPDQIYKGKK